MSEPAKDEAELIERIARDLWESVTENTCVADAAIALAAIRKAGWAVVPVGPAWDAVVLKAENARLREAVSFYRAMLVGKVRDGGAIARAALAGEVKP